MMRDSQTPDSTLISSKRLILILRALRLSLLLGGFLLLVFSFGGISCDDPASLALSSTDGTELSASIKQARECIRRSKEQITNFDSPVRSHSDAVALCSGAADLSPLDCALRAKKEFSGACSDQEIVQLCASARSVAPIVCARAGLEKILVNGHPIKSCGGVVALCRQATDTKPIDCATQLQNEMENSTTQTVQTEGDIFNICAAAHLKQADRSNPGLQEP